MLMNTPQVKSRVSRHPAARALQEQVDGDGAPKEAHVIDKMLFSPVKGQELKVNRGCRDPQMKMIYLYQKNISQFITN